MTINPLKNQVLVQLAITPPVAGEIIVPPSKFELKKFVVKAKGPQVLIAIGATVLSDALGYTVKDGNETYYLINDEDILATVS